MPSTVQDHEGTTAATQIDSQPSHKAGPLPVTYDRTAAQIHNKTVFRDMSTTMAIQRNCFYTKEKLHDQKCKVWVAMGHEVFGEVPEYRMSATACRHPDSSTHAKGHWSPRSNLQRLNLKRGHWKGRRRNSLKSRYRNRHLVCNTSVSLSTRAGKMRKVQLGGFTGLVQTQGALHVERDVGEKHRTTKLRPARRV